MTIIVLQWEGNKMGWMMGIHSTHRNVFVPCASPWLKHEVNNIEIDTGEYD